MILTPRSSRLWRRFEIPVLKFVFAALLLSLFSCTKKVAEPEIALCEVTDLGFGSYNRVGSPVFADGNHGMIYIDNTKIYRTTDGGNQWSSCYSATNGLYYLAYPTSDTALVAVLTSSTSSTTHFTTFRTTDGGQTWTQAFLLNNISCLTMYSGKEGYAVGAIPPSTTRLLLHTVDGGVSWALAYGNPPANNTTALQFFDELNGYAYVGTNNGFEQYKTSNRGVHWTDLGHCKTYSRINTSGVGFRDDGQSIYKTSDFGDSWKMVWDYKGQNMVRQIDFSDDGLAVVTFDGILIVSTDNGENWHQCFPKSFDFNNYRFYGMSVPDRHTIILTGHEYNNYDEFMLKLTLK